MIIRALLEMVPWYWWLFAVLIVVALTYLGAWPIVGGFLRGLGLAWQALPPKVKQAVEIVAAFVFLVVIHFALVHVAVATAVEAEKERGKVALAGQRDMFQKQLQDARDTAQVKLDELTTMNAKLAAKLDAAIKLAETRRVQAVANLKKGFASYVTPLQLSRCPDVSRGFLLYGADAATYANGGAEDPPAAPASAAALDPPSGVSLAALADPVADQAGAYRACRNRVTQWELWAKDVDTYVANLQSIFQPKGVTAP